MPPQLLQGLADTLLNPSLSCGRLAGAGSGSHCGVEFGRSRTGWEEEGGGVRSGQGEARTILLLHILSARPSKQPLIVRTLFKVYMELLFCFCKNKFKGFDM